MKEEIEQLKETLYKRNEKIDQLTDQLAEANYNLDHFRKALSAVKWLWNQAQKQTEFQL